MPMNYPYSSIITMNSQVLVSIIAKKASRHDGPQINCNILQITTGFKMYIYFILN